MSTSTPTISAVTDPSAISRYNRGPLTTVFAPPTSCVATLTLPSPGTAPLYFGHSEYFYLDESCYPLGTLSSENLVPTASWDLYYCKNCIVPSNLSVFHVDVRIDSPGLCPGGWTTATLITSLYQGFTAWLSLGPGTTAAVCCPQYVCLFICKLALVH